jgi:hypothetical protein
MSLLPTTSPTATGWSLPLLPTSGLSFVRSVGGKRDTIPHTLSYGHENCGFSFLVAYFSQLWTPFPLFSHPVHVWVELKACKWSCCSSWIYSGRFWRSLIIIFSHGEFLQQVEVAVWICHKYSCYSFKMFSWIQPLARMNAVFFFFLEEGVKTCPLAPTHWGLPLSGQGLFCLCVHQFEDIAGVLVTISNRNFNWL